MVRIVDRGSETITIDQAYRAVAELALTYRETGNRTENEIARFGSAAGSLSLEDDRFDAVEKVLIVDADHG